MLELGHMFQIKLIGLKAKSYWVEKTKLLEDRLSDRLHEELNQNIY